MNFYRQIGLPADCDERGSPIVCWTRMQAEAGQTLEQIIARKELERRANDGVFFWGVGNAPAVAIRALARATVPVPVIFSVMKSKPKREDVSPGAVVAWQSYIDADGVERDVPAHSIVLSRAESAGGVKRAHYALMCRSSSSLGCNGRDDFDPTQYRNFGGREAPVGASQVTALLRRIETDVESDNSAYRIDMRADLTGGYWVRLTRPVLLREELRQSVAAAGLGSQASWISLANEVRVQGKPQEEQCDRLL